MEQKTEKQNKGGSSVFILAIIIILVALCALLSVDWNPDKKNKYSAEYRVTKSTGLYRSPDFDSELDGVLSAGDTLQIPGSSLNCKVISEPGNKAELCYLYSPKLKVSGWVLSKWIKRK